MLISRCPITFEVWEYTMHAKCDHTLKPVIYAKYVNNYMYNCITKEQLQQISIPHLLTFAILRGRGVEEYAVELDFPE